jgi:hypothetical protein
VVAPAIGVLALAAAAAPARAAGSHAANKAAAKAPLLTFVSESAGERSVEASDLRFSWFQTTYKHTSAPKSESATGERIEVVQKRKDCSCVRFADYSKVGLQGMRQVDVTYPEGGRVALVRLTWRDGKVREYRATELYGGDGLFPPRFSATVEGQHREFPLVLPDTPEAAWPEERLVRMILSRPSPPPAKKTDAKKSDTSAPH